MKLDNIIEAISLLIDEDGENQLNQSEIIKATYANAVDSEKKIIDEIMICICGYSLDTIINNPEKFQVN